jgi:hypothetical protein
MTYDAVAASGHFLADSSVDPGGPDCVHGLALDAKKTISAHNAIGEVRINEKILENSRNVTQTLASR